MWFSKNIKSLLTNFSICLVLSGCLTPFDFRGEISGGIIAVSGQISTITDRNFVQLGITANTLRLPLPVSDANITLISESSNVVQNYVEDVSNLGRYTLIGQAGLPGETYHIEIELKNGKKYKSVPEKMPAVSVTSSSFYEVTREQYVDGEGAITEQPFLKIYSNVSLPVSSNSLFLKWNIEEVFRFSPTDFPDPFGSIPPPCFIVQNADPLKIVLFSSSKNLSSFSKSTLVASRLIDYSFYERHYFTIYQSSLTQEAYDYWNKVRVLATQSGSIFDTPPAEITGNIYRLGNSEEKVLGYFQTANQTYDRFFLVPTDFSFKIPAESCTFDGSFSTLDYEPRCIDCLSIRNSSYARPDWF